MEPKVNLSIFEEPTNVMVTAKGDSKAKNLFLSAVIAFLSGLAFTAQNALVANEVVSFSEVLTVRYIFIITTLFIVTTISVEVKKCRKDDDNEYSVFRSLSFVDK